MKNQTCDIINKSLEQKELNKLQEYLENYFEGDIDEFDGRIILNLEQFISDVKNI